MSTKLRSLSAYRPALLTIANACWLASTLLVGCAAPTSTRFNPQALYKTLESKTQRNFAQAVYAKPAINDRSILYERLAPIIIHEVSQTAEQANILSRYYPTAASSFTHDVHLLVKAKATVYYSLGSVKISQAQYDQVLYFWFYKSQDDAGQTNAQLRGVRMTVGLDGFPLAWELITGMPASINHDTFDVIYVSQSGESAARSLYGEPQPHRRYAIERSWLEASNTIVANLVQDGPMPMGSYIYVQSKGHDISAVLCRCSPSQAESFVEEITYELIPAESLNGFSWEAIKLPTPLYGRLRWPTGQ